jgi:hypothetical protein
MAGWAARGLGEIPKVTDGEASDPEWYPLQHFFGITTFGANVFVATHGHETLVGEHDERSSGQQELYVVLEGEAEFDLAGERVRAGARNDHRRDRSGGEAAGGRARKGHDAPSGRSWRGHVLDDVEAVALQRHSSRRRALVPAAHSDLSAARRPTTWRCRRCSPPQRAGGTPLMLREGEHKLRHEPLTRGVVGEQLRRTAPGRRTRP